MADQQKAGKQITPKESSKRKVQADTVKATELGCRNRLTVGECLFA
jgi:hypothetical protein